MIDRTRDYWIRLLRHPAMHPLVAIRRHQLVFDILGSSRVRHRLRAPALDRFEAAEALLLPSSSALIEALGPSNPLSLKAQRRLVRLYEATERMDDAGQLRARLDALDER